MSDQSSTKITLESSLKALEIENFLDRYFYRPIAFRISLLLSHTSVTPNMVTILSILVGVGAGLEFFSNDIRSNLFGVALLIMANTLDCVDGQLARLTGIKSKIGRILDGFAGDLWFFTIYVCLGLRLINDGWPAYIFLVGVASGLAHSRQAAIADYFKNLHLYFLKGAAGAEFDEYSVLEEKYSKLSWKTDFIEKFFQYFYRFYTRRQERMAPDVLELRRLMASRFPDEIPLRLTEDFRNLSQRAIHWMHILAFNGRTPVLFASVLLDVPWVYFLFELIFLNLAMILGIRHYARISQTIKKAIESGVYEKK